MNQELKVLYNLKTKMGEGVSGAAGLNQELKILYNLKKTGWGRGVMGGGFEPRIEDIVQLKKQGGVGEVRGSGAAGLNQELKILFNLKTNGVGSRGVRVFEPVSSPKS